MDKVASFIYKNQEYSGYIVASENNFPFFYWFVFNDQELQEKIGDEVGFILINDDLVPAKSFTLLADKHTGLFKQIKERILYYISQRSSC